MSAPIANDGAASPLFTVLLVVSAAQKYMFPALDASNAATWVTVPQFAVGAGKVMATLLDVVPPVPVLAPEPDAWVFAQFVVDCASAVRAYEPPLTSVPPPESLGAAGGPAAFDVIVLAGNVMVYLAPGTEPRALRVLSDLLVPRGRIVTGFATDREYTVADLDRDAAETGLTVEHRFATWHLDPWFDGADWAVTVLRRGE